MRGESCGYCGACVRQRLSAARGRRPEPAECAYRHILESYGAGETPAGAPRRAPPHAEAQGSPGRSCCRWTSDAQFPEYPSSGDLSLEWDSGSSTPRYRRRRRK